MTTHFAELTRAAEALWMAYPRKSAHLWPGSIPLHQARSAHFPGRLQLGAKAQEASAFCLSWSNSCWVIAPLSSRLFADAIWSAGLAP